MMQDGLGSVRGVVSHANAVLESRQYDPIGNNIGTTGTSQTSYGFTGEMTFGDLLHLRARDYNPALGVFTALDPFEGTMQHPMSLNGYSYVEGNPVNLADPSGMQACIPGYNCSLPNPGGIFIPDSNGDFNGTIPQVNLGDFDTENMLRICNYLNNGMCSQERPFIFQGQFGIGIFESRKIPKDQIEQLRKQCEARDNEACYMLALALSEECKGGRRSACRKIAELCGKTKDPRLCDLELRRTCSIRRYRQLYNIYKSLCQGFTACTEIDDCDLLAAKMLNRVECQLARMKHADECLGGAPDEGHQEQIDVADQHFWDCIEIWIRKQPPCSDRILDSKVQRKIETRMA